MYLAASTLSPYFVETVCPVYAEITEYREVDARTHAGTALKIERREVAYACPAISGFGKSDGVDGGRRLEKEGEMKLECEFTVGISLVA